VIPYIKAIINAAKINNKNSIIKSIFFTIIDLSLMSMVILSFYLIQNVDSKRVIYVPKGSTEYIISYLNKNNYSVNFIDKWIIQLIGYPQSGWIDLKNTSMTKLDFLFKLTHSKAALKSVTLLPGETYYFFLIQISKKLNISNKKLTESYFKYAYKLDGNIVPQTYSLPYGMKSDDIIKYLMKYSNRQYEKISQKIFGSYNRKNWYKYIIIASIIQKEAALKNEMPKVASVIYNRLNKKMKLQMDGTLNYAEFSHIKITPKRIKDDTSNYNTYRTKGIPSNPICAVEFEAIKSAIFPQKTSYLYFMKSTKGNYHIFTNSLKAHQNVIKKVRNTKRFTAKKSIKQTIKKHYKKLHKNTKTRKKLSTFKLWKSVY
jgi:UPF0755 protein